MSERVIKLSDVGEGVAEAEIVELMVKVGELVREGDVLVAVMTDKATVELPSPADGRVSWIGCEVGQKAAVGSELIKIEVGDGADTTPEIAARTKGAAATDRYGEQLQRPQQPRSAQEPSQLATVDSERSQTVDPATSIVPRAAQSLTQARSTDRPIAAPAVRAHARDHGVDLRFVRGSGPAGRILREDVDAYLAGGVQTQAVVQGSMANTAVEEIKIIGLRRRIAQRLQDTVRRIPHFSYIEEVDVTDLESLRADINETRKSGRPRLTVLPFLMRALVMALREFPQMNARFDDSADILHRYGGAHIGVAIQTPNGLVVAVVRHAEARMIWDCASEVKRLTEAARSGTITREELTGSTITITSLGALGGIASTPVINSPEVAIVGVNKMAIKPVWRGAAFEPRKIMNLSSSFDHRIIDGWDAAQFIQHLRSLLEAPAKIFMET
jgi:2-oxoisovalerate dehydrogenase E2 component (dihydrolipoyl transacylase)